MLLSFAHQLADPVWWFLYALGSFIHFGLWFCYLQVLNHSGDLCEISPLSLSSVTLVSVPVMSNVAVISSFTNGPWLQLSSIEYVSRTLLESGSCICTCTTHMLMTSYLNFVEAQLRDWTVVHMILICLLSPFLLSFFIPSFLDLNPYKPVGYFSLHILHDLLCLQFLALWSFETHP